MLVSAWLITYLEHVLTHGTSPSAIDSVLERLIFEVELDVVLFSRFSDCDVEEHLYSAFGDGT